MFTYLPVTLYIDQGGDDRSVLSTRHGLADRQAAYQDRPSLAMLQ